MQLRPYLFTEPARKAVQVGKSRYIGYLMNAKTFYPDDLLAHFQVLRDQMSDEEFFCKPGMTRVREMWCAAHFGRAFNRFIAPCQIVIDDIDTQDDVDFDLIVENTLYPFQIAEVMEPDRRRSDEYKKSTTRFDDWSRGTDLGAEWIRQAIEKKLQKYSSATKLNLLLYLNFAAHDQKYNRIRVHSLAVASCFSSVWLLNGDSALACLSPNPLLPHFEGWLQIEESPVHDVP